MSMSYLDVGFCSSYSKCTVASDLSILNRYSKRVFAASNSSSCDNKATLSSVSSSSR